MNNISIFEGKSCYGCGVCTVACPKRIISLKLNHDGFWEPKIVNEDKCIDCGICLRVCSFNADDVVLNTTFKNKAYAVSCKDNMIIQNSTSGGFAFVLAKRLFEEGFLSCVVKYNYEKHIAEHYIAQNENELLLSQGSKYLPSFTEEAFKKLLNINSQKILIVGCPCQIDSLRRFFRLRKREDNVLLVDFYCHGVPSYLMWKKYLTYAYSRVGNINEIKWRSKINGWQNSTTMHVKGENGEFYSPYSSGDYFYNFFLGDRCLGKSCYDHCKFKRDSAADIRIGDLWGKKYMHSSEGVSAVKIQTMLGENYFNLIADLLNCETVDIKTLEEGQIEKPALRSCSYHFVTWALKSNLSLMLINKIATLIEYKDTIPSAIKYYYKRIPEKLGLK